MPAERIALGTAQFGFPYGIANATGQVPAAEVSTILAEARTAGVDTIDTAIAYGDAEVRLGAAGVSGFQVVSKLPALPDGLTDAGDIAAWVFAQVRGSLERLRVERLHAVLLHRASDLVAPAGPALADALLAVRDAGLTVGQGVSVYAPTELEAVVDRLPMSLVQLPCSVVDRRFVTSGWIDRLADQGVEVHARSAFLQGVLLMPASSRPAWCDRWAALWTAWEQWQRDTGQSAMQGCLASVLAVPGLSRIVVGIDGAAHLRDILAALSGPLVAPPEDFGSGDRDLVEPTRWRAQ